MIYRELQRELLDIAQHYPVVTVLGPRQSGKTTLVKNAFKDKNYVNLELPNQRILAKADPVKFLEKYPDGAVIDEIQRVPELLSYIQVIVDTKKIKGFFILTGSHQLELHQEISQSLAGRTALLTLLPLSIKEITASQNSYDLNMLLLNGGFPNVFQDKMNPTKFYSNYFKTYVERDLKQLINVKDLNTFERFVKLCAGRIGSIFIANNLANEVGRSNHSIQNWLSILEASFIVFRLQPYFNNFNKRIIKSPKLYFTDVGLACYLLGIETISQLETHPLRGELIENLVILDLMKARLNNGLDPNLYFYRDNSANEVDVIFSQANNLIPIEIKSSQTFHNDFLKGLKIFKKIASNNCQNGYLIYAGTEEQAIADFQVINYRNAYKIVSPTEKP